MPRARIHDISTHNTKNRNTRFEQILFSSSPCLERQILTRSFREFFRLVMDQILSIFSKNSKDFLEYSWQELYILREAQPEYSFLQARYLYGTEPGG